MQTRLTAHRFLFWAFALLPILYFCLYAFKGFSDTDSGFIPALSYRVLNGEIPGRDFFYVRPPLSPYLHTLELILLPDSLEMVGMRFFYYLYMWLAVWLGIQSLRSQFDFQKLGLSPWLLGILAFVFSAHNFPAMPWHTLDGILFACLGFYLLTRGPQMAYLVGGMVAMVLSAMAKQPFAVAPVVGAGMLFFLYPSRAAVKGLLLSAGLGVLVLVGMLVFDREGILIGSITGQVKGASSLEDLKLGAYQMYRGPLLLFFVPIALLWGVLTYLRWPHKGLVLSCVILLGIAAWVGYQTYSTYKAEHFVAPRYGFYHVLLAGAFAVGFWQFLRRKDVPQMVLLLAMSVVAWASGISWGYAFPALFALPGLIGVVYFLAVVNAYPVKQWAYGALAVIALGGFFAMHYYPYMERPLPEVNKHLGDLFPRMQHIYTHQALYDKHAQMKALHAKYGDNFTVLPSMPLAHYMLGIQAPVQVDWAHDGEIGFEKGAMAIVQRLEERKTVVLVEKERKDEAFLPRGNYKCSVLEHVLGAWKKVEEDAYFEVFVMPELVSDSVGTLAP